MKRRTELAIMAVVIFAAMALAASTSTEDASQKIPQAKIGEAAPDFALKDTYDKSFTMAEFKGKIVVLEWVNQFCPVSKGAHQKQKMQNLYKKYADKGVIWLGIDSTYKAEPEKNRVYAAQMGLTFPLLHDPDGKVGKAYGATRTPHMFVIDKNGKLAYDGAIDDQDKKNYVALAIEDLLADRPVAKSKTAAYGCGIKYAPSK